MNVSDNGVEVFRVQSRCHFFFLILVAQLQGSDNLDICVQEPMESPLSLVKLGKLDSGILLLVWVIEDLG
jgi:hypothetical protein